LTVAITDWNMDVCRFRPSRSGASPGQRS
jgi:hypothetical protein